MPFNLSISAEPAGPYSLTVRILARGERPGDLPGAAVEDAEKEPVLLYQGGERFGIVVIGEDGERLEEVRIAGSRAAALAHRARRADAAILTEIADADELAALVEGFVLGGYRFVAYKTEVEHVVASLALVGQGAPRHEAAARAALVRAESACVARDLVNRSPHEKTAPLMAELVRAIAESVGLACEVWDRERIEEERMGGLLAVSRGSVAPPRFVVLAHRPAAAAAEPPVVLVGKTIVFDTGGLSLKPTEGSMDRMKADMAGGAAVLGAMRALALLEAPLHAVALLPMTDNRPGGDAYVPGDVVTMRSGHTVEVLNTDAEGRMLLADALDYAKELHPALVIDVATLTGAAVIALGHRVAAAMTHDDAAAAERLRPFIEAGSRTGEYVHPLPTHAHYAEALKSDVADLKNVGGREGGAITAAKFLERFTRSSDGSPAYPWVHLDIAGTAFTDKPQPYRPVGGTGFGVRLLVDVLMR